MPTPYTGPESTLGALRDGHGWCWVNCTIDCGHASALPLAPIAARLGEDAPADQAAARLSANDLSESMAAMEMTFRLMG